jgi:hypothetical protein
VGFSLVSVEVPRGCASPEAQALGLSWMYSSPAAKAATGLSPGFQPWNLKLTGSP